MHYKLIIPGNASRTIETCAQHFVYCCKRAIKDHGAFFVALSGGSTPTAIYQMLTQAPFVRVIDWSKVWLFWGDERSVPPDHPDSNYHMAMEAGFKNVPIPKAQIHRMEAEREIEHQAAAYEKLVKKHPLDLVMLGMGEDGHTASLFPETAALNVTDRLVVANHVPQKNTWRMTLTFPCINRAQTIAIYVLGTSKRERLKEVLHNPKADLPIQKVGTSSHPALWFLDTLSYN